MGLSEIDGSRQIQDTSIPGSKIITVPFSKITDVPPFSIEPVVVKLNTDSVGMIPGQLAYLDTSTSGFKLSIANNRETSQVFGIITIGGSPSSTVTCQIADIVDLTTSEWDDAWGTTGGLSPGLVYWLSPLFSGRGIDKTGLIYTPGYKAVRLGIASSSTKFVMGIQAPIGL